MKAKILAMVVAGLSAVLLAGCGGSSGGDTDVTRIKAQFREMQKGLESKDIQRVMSVYSYNFLDSGYTYDDVKNGVANLFIDFNNIKEDQVFHSIRVSGDTAYISWTETLTGTDAYTGELKQSVTSFDDVMRWEHGYWLFYGNQQNSVGVKKAARYSGQRLREAPAKAR